MSKTLKMKRYLLILLMILVTAGLQMSAQSAADRELIKSRSNVKKLLELSSKFHDSYTQGLKKHGQLKSTRIGKDSTVSYLSGFDSNGNPVYDHDDNYNAAITSKVNVIRAGGKSGTDLTGVGIEIGQWEASGLPWTTHQEFGGRVKHAEDEAESSHSTHTACTMIGAGVDSLAKGMAPEATVVSRRSNNDEAELAAFGAAGGLISNHSYSTGDPDGEVSRYGIYTDNSAEWDEILFNAPYLSVCKSAGNDRNDDVNPRDFGYDILFTVAVSKNLLTIGAVEDIDEYTGPKSVVQAEFSSWGPTDDWRIKPDLVANGVDVYSTDDTGNASYHVRSGTSMSSPVVAGTIALLQQYYHDLNDDYMRSATVKALLINTTDEAGRYKGPDFQNGWGLMNAERAADVITNNGKSSWIKEMTLNYGSTYTHYIRVDSGVPLNITVAWTDPPGTPVEKHDDQTPMLVNDLDVRLTGKGKVYEPWTMNPNDDSNNFSDAAVKGDNYRDNVERIDVDSLSAGLYAVKVTHKGKLKNGHQDFSIVINGLAINTSSGDEIRMPEESLKLYPQPVRNGILNVKLPESLRSGEVTVTVFDSSGRMVKVQKIHYGNSTLNVSDLKTGLYFIRVSNNKKVVTGRFVVE